MRGLQRLPLCIRMQKDAEEPNGANQPGADRDAPGGAGSSEQYPWRTAENEPFDSGRRYIWRYEIRPKVQANRAQRAQFRQIGGFSRFYRSQSLQALQQNHEKTERCLNAP